VRRYVQVQVLWLLVYTRVDSVLAVVGVDSESEVKKVDRLGSF
jgi:hypothetical protein